MGIHSALPEAKVCCAVSWVSQTLSSLCHGNQVPRKLLMKEFWGGPLLPATGLTCVISAAAAAAGHLFLAALPTDLNKDGLGGPLEQPFWTVSDSLPLQWFVNSCRVKKWYRWAALLSSAWRSWCLPLLLCAPQKKNGVKVFDVSNRGSMVATALVFPNKSEVRGRP